VSQAFRGPRQKAAVLPLFTHSAFHDLLACTQVRDNVAIHVPCTSKKLGVSGAFEEIAALCAKEVTPSGIPCCGEKPFLLDPTQPSTLTAIRRFTLDDVNKTQSSGLAM